ncbi:5-enolpyruvylshikimate-3-phosphate synthase [Lachnospiraceae bacterium KM106-2]|nr:5-enolpyruvylshikimate-3-phosphate synthase [Lachnospiraceae bacterium KM106-2]
MKLNKANHLLGEIIVPGDKSISHRSIMLGAIAKGDTKITHFLQGADCLSTISCFQKMGISIENNRSEVIIHGKGLHGLKCPNDLLDVGNSGTTTRLMSGILAAQPFTSCVNGDASLQKRPMNRIIKPLSLMGADIESDHGNGCTPLTIHGKPLKAIHYDSPVASAQVKSSILLAGLYAEGNTSVTEPFLSRNHTEIMLNFFGGNVLSEGTTATVYPEPSLEGRSVQVPGDISSAAYFIVAGLITPKSEILIKNVGINPTRDGILRVCNEMGADIKLLNQSDKNGEPSADILVKTSNLKGITIGGSIIPTLIDEIPIIAVLACFANGTTIIKDAAELKVKESNRIDVVVKHLQKMGAHITATEDGMVIEGGYPLNGAVIESNMDHRIAMSFAIAALNAYTPTTIKHAEIVDVSYPGFFEDIKALQR